VVNAFPFLAYLASLPTQYITAMKTRRAAKELICSPDTSTINPFSPRGNTELGLSTLAEPAPSPGAN